MRVKERLRRGFTAMGIVAGFAVATIPGSTPGQIVEATEPYQTVEQNPAATADSTAEASAVGGRLSATDQLYLQARQAVAFSDVKAAQDILGLITENSEQPPSALGETADAIRVLMKQQNELVQLASTRDPGYNHRAATFLVKQAKSMLKFGDSRTAEMLANQAGKFEVAFPPGSDSPDSIMAAIASAKNPAGNADTDSQLADADAIPQVLSLMSRAEFAFDQGELNLARSLTLKAAQLGVPDTQFPANQTLPWQLDLKIQEAMKSGGNVVPASFENATSDQVVQADYFPETDKTRNVQASATMHAGAAPGATGIPEFSPIPGKAMQMYESGLKALQAKDQSAAREYFQLAWQGRDQLDEDARQTIQDQLNSLTESTEDGIEKIPPSPTTPESEDLPTTATEDQPETVTGGEEEQKFRRLQSQVFEQRRAAELAREENPRKAIEMLTQMRGKIVEADISEQSKRPLLNFIDRDIAEFQRFIEQNLSDIQLNEDNAGRLESVNESREQRYNTELQIQKLVEDFNKLMDEQRYPEARVVARQAAALDPESEIATLLLEKSAIQTNLATMEDIQDQKSESFLNRLADVDRDSINPVTEDTPLLFGDTDKYSRDSRVRLERLANQQYRSPEERRIWNLLKTEKVQGHYQGTLADAINQLSEQSGVNIIFDSISLNADSITVGKPVDIPIRQPISLQSALNVILGTSGLVFVVEDEVVKVTSRDAQRRDVKPHTYYVGDLVTPIQNFTNSLSMNFLTPYGQVGNNGFIGQGQSVPLASQNSGTINPLQMASQSMAATSAESALAQQLPGGLPGGLPGALGRNPFLGGGTPQAGIPTYTSTGPQAPGGVTEADFQPLIRLIRTSIDPDGWDDTNGDGTISAYVTNLSLIVSQTQEVQDEIQDLLNQLRELNDVQIVVEVRFVSLSDNFFERIGVDFDFNLNDNSGLTPGAIGDRSASPSAVIGLNSSAATPIFSPDLDIPFRQGSFESATPLFGGFDPASAASFGFAILSDIEVFFLINAAKGDQRTNITQAPTVTMFNGQVASVNDGAQVPFVTSVTPVVGDFAVAQQPIITLLPEGASLNVQATVSHDRKSVRMTLVPFFSQITDVKEFTFDGSTTTQRATDQSLIDDLLGAVTGNNDDDDTTGPEIETTTTGVTVQLPTLGFTTVSTVVSVPDGGTILIGGVKRQTEQRIERGVPFLSNIPYVSRLFKNVGIGRETSSLMMMVTPRIIIQEEEEEYQVGSFSN